MRISAMLAFLSVYTLLPLCYTSWVPAMENPAFIEGDMMLTPEQMEGRKTGLSYAAKKKGRWPKTTIYYEMTADMEGQAVEEIQLALAEYEKYTCLRFKPYDGSSGGDRMRFYKGRGCAADVGYHGGVHWVSLGPGCWMKAVVLHEVGHALGFYHEHNRPDRNEFLVVHKENIHELMRDQYNIKSKNQVDDKHFPYDYRSIMHYAKDSMAKSGTISMETVDPYYQDLIGTGSGLSEIDIEQINDMYECPKYEGALPVKQTPKCHDSNGYCESSARRGDCNQRWMKGKCRYSCKECTIDENVTYPPLPTVLPNKVTMPQSTVDPCREGYTCRFRKGRCHLQKVKSVCPKTCGLCK